MQMIFVNILSQRKCLFACKCRKNNVTLLMRVGTGSIDDSGAFVEFCNDEVADGILVIACNHDGFAQHDVLDNSVDHEGF